MAKRVEKPWGFEEIIVNTGTYVLKKITIDSGHRLSLQYHVHKEETVYVLEGTLIVWKSENFRDHETIQPGQVYHVKPGEIHRFGCPENLSRCVLLECSTPELEDVVRISDDYNRS